jgi:hypothetical protein
VAITPRLQRRNPALYPFHLTLDLRLHRVDEVLPSLPRLLAYRVDTDPHFPPELGHLISQVFLILGPLGYLRPLLLQASIDFVQGLLGVYQLRQ